MCDIVFFSCIDELIITFDDTLQKQDGALAFRQQFHYRKTNTSVKALIKQLMCTCMLPQSTVALRLSRNYSKNGLPENGRNPELFMILLQPA